MTRNILNIFSASRFAEGEIKLGKFVKEVIREGEWINPSDNSQIFKVTKDRMLKWIENFKNKVCEIVPIPLTHSNDPMDNTGVVEDIYVEQNKDGSWSFMSVLNILLENVVSRIGKTILGNSIAVDTHYIDTKTGADMGETLIHIALTNIPHIEHLGEFKPVMASKEGEEIKNDILIPKSTSNEKTIKNEKQDKEQTNKGGNNMDFDIVQMNKDVDIKVNETVTKAISTLETKFTKEIEDRDKKILELTKHNFEKAIDSKVDELVRAGKITAEESVDTLKFCKENPTTSEAYIAMLAKLPKKVEFGQRGVQETKNESTDVPKQSALMQMCKDFITRKGEEFGVFGREKFEGNLKNWVVQFDKAGQKFLSDGIIYQQGGFRFTRTSHPEIVS